MSLSKRRRFEVFKRDKFTCSYCGRQPPEVILNADHVIPKSAGGPDVIENLTTACFDCNSGKSDVPLTCVPVTVEQQTFLRSEKLAQVSALRRMLKKEMIEREKAFHLVSDEWILATGSDPKRFEICGPSKSAILDFLERLPLLDVIKAAKALWRVKNAAPNRQLKYFCGVCWSIVREKEGKGGF